MGRTPEGLHRNDWKSDYGPSYRHDTWSQHPLGRTADLPTAFLPRHNGRMTTSAILGPGGSIARAWPAYESRPEQVAMSDAVAAAIAEGRHLMVEAGTGVGK